MTWMVSYRKFVKFCLFRKSFFGLLTKLGGGFSPRLRYQMTSSIPKLYARLEKTAYFYLSSEKNRGGHMAPPPCRNRLAQHPAGIGLMRH